MFTNIKILISRKEDFSSNKEQNKKAYLNLNTVKYALCIFNQS